MTWWARLRGREFAELLAAAGFAITQPILSVFGKSPDAFIYRHARPADIVVFALVVALGLPVAVWLVESGIAVVSRSAARVAHVVALAGLVGLWAVQTIATTTDLRGAMLLALALVTTGGLIVAYLESATARTFLGFLVIGPVIFVVLFLVASPTSDLVTPAAASIGTGRGTGGSPPIVLVVFDEWPTSSAMDSRGAISTAFPHLRALAATSSWYRNASSVSNSTPYAVPAILTGSMPRQGLPTAATYPHSVFDAFGPGYRLAAGESVTSLCPASACRSASSGAALTALFTDARDTFRRMISLDRTKRDPTTSFVEGVRADEARVEHRTVRRRRLTHAVTRRPARFEDFLAGFHEGEAPTIHVLHILLPHVPYRFLPSGAQYAAPVPDLGRTGDVWTKERYPVALAHQRLLLQAAYVDRLIGELVGRLHRTHLFSRAVVAITADHGITFAPGRSSRGLSDAPIPTSDLPEMLDAPLLVKGTGQTRAVVSDANVMSIDILPTLAHLAGRKLPWPVDGVVAGTRASHEKLFRRANGESGDVTLSGVRRYNADAALRTLLADDDVDSLTHARDGRFRLFNPRGLGGLVGRSVASVAVGPPSAIAVRLTQRAALEAPDPTTGTLPAMVWGLSSKSTTIAVALNGTVAAVSPTFPIGKGFGYAAMVPDALIRARNTVALYEVSGLPGRPAFHMVK